jgi:N-acetylmuramoyl-L-alanine amidase
VAYAPIKISREVTSPAKLWGSNLHVQGNIGNSAKKIKLNKKNQAKVKKYRLALKKQKAKAARKKRLAGIKKSCGIKVSSKDITILERIVQAEAGDQGHEGKRLVANVIINRVKSKKFPSTVQKVVFAPRQFSPITDGSYERAVVTKDTKKAVNEALHGKDNSQGALYFMDRRYAAGSNIRWFDTSLTRLFQYNGHEFYK